MIVPMKKVSLVVMNSERDSCLERMRDLGVVHLEKKSVSSDALGQLLEKLRRCETAIGILRNFVPAEGGNVPPTMAVPGDIVDAVLDRTEKKKAAQEELSAFQKEKSRIDKWGNFDPLALGDLSGKGTVLIPYELPRKAYENIGKDDQVILLSSDKTLVRCVSLGRPLPGETPFALPDRSLADLERSIADLRSRLGALQDELSSFAVFRGKLELHMAEIAQDTEFEVARVSMESTADSPEELAVSWISGYVPADDAGFLKRVASEHAWALIVDDPSEGDVPPTKVKNNFLVRLVQPVFDLLGTVPGYREYDISLSFLLFFSLFFAMIFGDGGYGAVLLGLAVIFGIKAKSSTGKIPDGVLLIGLLSLSTVAWGAITGTWFALPLENLPSFLQALVIPPFYPDPALPPKDAAKLVQQNVKHLCFIIGAVQLVLAHLKNIKKAFPSLTALAQLGWLSMVVGLYFLVLNLVLDKDAFPVPAYALYMIGGGLFTYFLFVEQKGGNFFKNILSGFGNFLPTFLSAVSSFSDIISYIRLFAVGLAGFAIAQSFNGMAGSLPDGIVRIAAGMLILFFGHGLNLAMSALSVVVHGVRLNMLEYSGHLGMEWSGIKYAPFAPKIKRDVK
jgi:V/A-type H+-transporting ATPase subunit I